MKSKVICLHLLIILLLPLMAKSFFGDVIECKRDPQDSSSCTFNGIEDSTQLYRSLMNNEDISKSSIKKIRFSNTQLTHMPKELTTTYTNVEDLDASNVQLWRFVKIDFGPNTHLRKFNASFNKIHWLTTDMMEGMKELEILDLSHNIIDLIDRNAFSYNPNFKYLNMSHNRIGKLSADFFDAIRSVKVLHLNNNRISSITGDVSSINMQLDELYLNNNELLSFNPALVKQANILDISENNLQEEITFANTKLSDLNIRGNSLKYLTINNELTKLDASDNTERSFGISFSSNILLTHVSLSNLDIVDYDELLESLKNLHGVEYLDLSQNNLEAFDFKKHPLPTALKTLNLRRTDLHSLSNWMNLKNFLPNLQEINIQDNFLSCTELPQMLKSFQESKLNVTGLSDGNESKFLSENCVPETHRKRKPAEKNGGSKDAGSDSSSSKIILITLLIMCLLGYAFAGFVYLNKKFDILQRLIEKTSWSGRGTQFNNPRTNLLDESA